MRRWDYLLVRADWFSGGMRAFTPEKKTIALDQYLTALGEDGWEVVAMQHTPSVSESGKLLIILKRPKV
jgi:hypothetical protein